MALATSSPAVATGGTSTSAITAATVTGSHVLRIYGYSRTRGLGVRRYIESSKLLVAGHTWIVRYYPNGSSQEYADSISLFLFHCDRRSVRTQFTFSLHDPEGSHVQVHSQTTRCPVSFDPASRPSWGFPNFIKREDFEKSKYLRDDRFTIVCDIAVINGFYNGGTEKLVDAVPPSDLHQDLGWLLATGDGADVKFKVGDKLFFAHKGVVAARSSVFRTELFGPMKGVTVKDVVEIHDMEPEVFMAMLKFMYTDLVPIMRMGEEIAMAQHLLVAADRYDLKRLKLICENELCSRLTKKTAMTTLVLAEQHGCHGLKKACFAFLSSLGSLKEAMGCDGYDHLQRSCPSLHDELSATDADATAALTGGSSSTVRPAIIAGYHVLKIECYSYAKQLGVGEDNKSATFNVGDQRWYLRCYPGGYNNDSANSISIFLSVDDHQQPLPKGEVKATFVFSLLDHAGEPVPAYTNTIKSHTFSTENRCWGIYKFIPRAVLERSYIDGDSFRIRCDIKVLKEFIMEDTTVAQLPAAPQPELHRHLGQLLAIRVGGDVTFSVAGEVITAHRCVLAVRSSVFMAELFGPMKEKASGCVITIDDMEARVFRAMLHFIYTDTMPEMEEGDKMTMSQHLLVAADRYDLERLKVMCENTMCSRIDTGTVANTLILAEQHCCIALKEACFKFLKAPGRFREVMASDGFDHLMCTYPFLFMEVLDKIAP
nr:unnamed protein product [Digitaria exilis]